MNNIKSYLRFLGRNKLYSLVNVVGLSVSLMFVILIASYTANEFSTDKFHENADEIYVMCNQEDAKCAYKIGERLKDRYPEVEKICCVAGLTWSNTPIPVEITETNISAYITTVDSTFLDIFSFELLSGDRNTALKTLDGILISESFAKKAFGNQDPINKRITIRDSLTFTVIGVIKDFKNTMFKTADIIMRIENLEYFGWSIGSIDDGFYDTGIATLFIQSTQGENLKAKESEIFEYFKTFYGGYKPSKWGIGCDTVMFIPMRELYFNKTIDINRSEWNTNNKMMLTILVLIGSLILIFAIINYINLTVAQTGFRAKETAARRLFGASKANLFAKMIFESSFLCFIAFFIGSLLAFSVEPYASKLIGIDINITNNITLANGLLSIIFISILGIISGIIPAIIISRFKPIDIVKGSFTFKSKLIFSKVFICIQSIITIILIACSITIYKQVDSLISYDYGYNSKAIINILSDPWEGGGIVGKELLFRDKLKSLPSVKNVGFTIGTPLSKDNNLTTFVVGVKDRISFQFHFSDSNAIQMLGIEFLKDNKLAEDGYWINQEALRLLGANEDLKSFKEADIEDYNYTGKVFNIAGIIKGFHMGDLSLNGTQKTPIILQIDNNLTEIMNVLVEVQGDLISAYKDVGAIYKEFSNGLEFNGKFIDQEIEERYQEHKRIQIIMILFTIAAIIISSLGLLAISTYFIQQRSREVAVRRIFGSTRKELLIRVIWRFMQLVLVAFVIASPIVWVVMDKWLSQFPYRIDMSIWIILGAGAFNLFIAFLTVYWQSSLAVNMNPTKSIMH